jgi:hypothetical protein
VGPLLESAKQDTMFTVGDVVYQVTAAPVLPGDTC